MIHIPRSVTEIKKNLLENGFPGRFNTVVILGSGLGGFTSTLKESRSIPYSRIPGFPRTSVQGHSGNLFSGYIGNRSVLAFSGRFHHYEGYELAKTVLPVHLAAAFHAEKIVISNAAGAVNTAFKVGDLMVIDDVFRPFQTLSAAPSAKTFRYNQYSVAENVQKIAAGIGLAVQRGTYLYVKGPNYETKAEIRAFRILGADVVGMSTAPELIEASRLKIPAAAISLITNMAAGIKNKKLDHSEVKSTAESRKEDFSRLVTEIIKKL